MARDEKLRRIGVDLPSDARVVVARIAADVRHQNLDILAFPTEFFGIHQPKVAAVAVAADCPKRTERSQSIGHFGRADVACVPDFVARLEIVQVFVVPIRMGVAEDSDFFHILVKCGVWSVE